MVLPRFLLSRLVAVGRVATVAGVLVACSALYAQKPETILNRMPTQADVDCDVPDPADVENCKVKRFNEQERGRNLSRRARQGSAMVQRGWNATRRARSG